MKRVKWMHRLICSRRRLKWRCWHANTPVCTQRINSCKCICISYERYQWTVGIRYQDVLYFIQELINEPSDGEPPPPTEFFLKVSLGFRQRLYTSTCTQRQTHKCTVLTQTDRQVTTLCLQKRHFLGTCRMSLDLLGVEFRFSLKENN